jgi:hypothetical protein
VKTPANPRNQSKSKLKFPVPSFSLSAFVLVSDFGFRISDFRDAVICVHPRNLRIILCPYFFAAIFLPLPFVSGFQVSDFREAVVCGQEHRNLALRS